MKPEQKAERVREILDKIHIDVDNGLIEHPKLTPGDLYVIKEVLRSAVFTWDRQAHFREVSKIRRAMIRVRQRDTTNMGWHKAKQIVEEAVKADTKAYHEALASVVSYRERMEMLAADRDYLRSVGSIPPGSPTW